MFSSINAPHWHLLVNHLPVVGVMGATMLLIYGMARRSSDVVVAAMWSFIIVAIVAFIAHATGDPAAAAIRNLPGIDGADIRAHDQASGYAMITSIILGVIAVVGIILGARRKKANQTNADTRTIGAPPKAIVIICLLVGLMDCAIMLRVSNLGGQIRHPEIRNVAPGLPKST